MQKIEQEEMRVGGVFTIEHVRDGVVIDTWQEKNLVTNEGLNALLDTYLNGDGTAKIPAWYVALFEGNYTPAATLTAATFTATATESIAYSEATRVLWVDAAASAQQITNSASKATFTMNATKTIYGAALISASAKSATTGVLFAASRFSVARAVVAADQLLITYTVQAASA